VTAGYTVQHNDDDTHATITATGPISERGRTVPMGEWIDPPFDANWFTVTGAGNSWVVSAPTVVSQFYRVSYTLIGKTMFLNVNITNSKLTIATGVNQISVAVPPGYRIAGTFASPNFVGRVHRNVGECINAGTQQGVYFDAQGGVAFILIKLLAGGNFADDSGGSFSVSGQCMFEVEAV
jgi:hypothetical protein